MLLIFGICAGSLGFYKYQQIKAAMTQKFVPPPAAVTSVIAKKEVWKTALEAVGSFSPAQGVTVCAEEAGKVVNIAFESGKNVQAGDLLVQLDIAVEQAQLQSLQAKQQLACLSVERNRQLKETDVVSQSELDQAESAFRQATADVAALEAAINRKTIRAPFSGSTGIRQMQLGQYLSPGTPVVSLQTLDPIHFDFMMTQQDLSQLGVGQMVHVSVDAFPKEMFEGKITAINPNLDNTTHNVMVQATFANADQRLRAGMYAKISVVLKSQKEQITLPFTAVHRAPYGDSVYVVEKMKDPEGNEYLGVREQFVTLGPLRGDQVAIITGLKGGEEVVSSGLFKLRPNGAVLINNQITPENSPQPHPTDS